jgi:uncharacterized protein YbjT (DUF2867 family)
MANEILVTGGTGTLGRAVVERLLDGGASVRVLSRGHRAGGQAPHHVGDLRSGVGLDAALAGVDAVVHCADPAGRLFDAAGRAGVAHLVYISIVGIDAVPMRMYRRKLDEERRLADSGVGWSVLRATQFHDLVALMLRLAAKPPVMVVPKGWSFQPVDVRDVASRLASIALGDPAGRVPDLAGPEVLGMVELARTYLAATGVRRRIAQVPVPGRLASAYRAGRHMAPDHADGTITFAEYLREQLAAGTLPYADAIRDYTRRRPRKT